MIESFQFLCFWVSFWSGTYLLLLVYYSLLVYVDIFLLQTKFCLEKWDNLLIILIMLANNNSNDFYENDDDDTNAAVA